MKAPNRVLAVACVLAFAASLMGQNTGRAQGRAPRILERADPHNWTLRIAVNLRPQTYTNVKSKMPQREVFDFTSAALVFPILRESASHVLRVPERELDGKLKLNGRVAFERPTEILVDYPAGVKLAKWGMQGWVGEEVELELQIPVTSYRTKFDEAAANKLKWPDSWGSARSALEPEYFIDMGFEGPYDMAPVKDLIKEWTNGEDAKKLPPAQLAKFLAGEVVKHVQTSGNGLSYARTGQMSGIALQGAPETARLGKGSEYDMVCLLVAAYRQVGLPARCVIGFDAGETRDGQFLAQKGASSLRAWVEFALIDPSQQDPVVWVPVDPVRIRKSSTRPPGIERAWPFFGAHTELDQVIPFAFQFFPPSKGVASYAPAFFGLMVTPKPPEHVIQALRFDAITTPKRGGDPEDRPGDPGR